jgi:hypothetical protein
MSVATRGFSGRTGEEAAQWLTIQRRADHRFFRECLILQREARDIPPLAPTAASARLMTPASERVQSYEDWKRGMIGYSHGSDPAGHVYFVLGRRSGFDRDDPDGILVESNDVVAGATGRIGIVPLTFFVVHWGHQIDFAATWLNGYDFKDFNAKPKPKHPNLGANYEDAIKAVSKAVKAHAKDKDERLHDLLVRDLAHMKARYKKYAA